MRAYLIDPEKKEITEVAYNNGIAHIKELIDAPLFDVVRINQFGDVIFVDDEGMFRNPQSFFRINGYPNPLAGKGLVLGTGPEGESIAPKTISLETLRRNVAWISRECAIAIYEKIEAEIQENCVKKEGFTYITTSTADILKSQGYTNEPSGETTDEAELPKR